MELGLAPRPDRQGCMTLSLSHSVFQCIWENPYEGGTFPWQMKRRKLKLLDMRGNVALYSRSIHCTARMNTPGEARNLSRPETTPGCLGQNPCPCGNGKEGVGETLISAMTNPHTALGVAQFHVVCAIGVAVSTFHLANVVAAATGRVRNTWWLLPAWREMCLCSHVTISWNRNQEHAFPGFVTTGNRNARDNEAWLRRPMQTAAEWIILSPCVRTVYQQREARSLRPQTLLCCVWHVVTCVRNFYCRNASATLLSTSLVFC
eukprot:3841492-Amphidinium_carterae.2